MHGFKSYTLTLKNNNFLTRLVFLRPSCGPGYGHGVKTNVEKVKKSKEKAIVSYESIGLKAK